VILNDDALHPFSQEELNDLVRDLNLSKSSADLLASRLKEKTFSLIVLKSPFTATDIKSSFVFILKIKTWFTVQILLSF